MNANNWSERLSNSKFQKLPKVDLHCHIDGALRVATIRDLAKEKNAALPTEDLQELAKYVQVPESCRSLGDFLKTFDFFYPFLMGEGPMERAMYELCEDMAKDGVLYFEGRFAPILQTNKNTPDRAGVMDRITAAVVRGAEAGMRDFGVECGIILCCYRSETPESSIATVELADKHRGMVVGIDLAGDEHNFPIESHAAAFSRAEEMELQVTIHAGEASGSESVRSALDIGKAKRIGHGVRIKDDEELQGRIRDEGICVECCLTSNLQTCTVADLSEHPFPRFREQGICATINTDDPGVSGISLSYEYDVASRAFDYDKEDLMSITLDAMDHAFTDQNVKERIKSKIVAGWS
ncbi:MAG: adenosine deaminase [Candidatus Lindowbacteria bacterium]|nr:adenosine deaminase [Candidatus Lindowbacteria bacterium]